MRNHAQNANCLQSGTQLNPNKAVIDNEHAKSIGIDLQRSFQPFGIKTFNLHGHKKKGNKLAAAPLFRNAFI